MDYEPVNFEHLFALEGFSEKLIKNHLTLYQGYVKNTNHLWEAMKRLSSEGKPASPEFAEIKRRFGWEFNGMRLHEYYFSSMRKTQRHEPHDSPLKRKLEEDFGSYEAWEKDFRATGEMRGIGWVLLLYDPAGERLLNVWINEHDLGYLAGTFPIIVMDVFEHAYMIDYGTKKAPYIGVFFKALDWDELENRFDLAVHFRAALPAASKAAGIR